MALRAAVLAALAAVIALVGAVPASAYVYWINRNTDGTQSIARVQNDGLGFSYRLIEGVQAEQTYQGGITGQVAVNDKFVYWTNTLTDTIGRANLDGTSVDQTFLTVGSAGPYNGPNGLAVTPNHVYYSSGNTIYRADADGRNAGVFYQDAAATDVDGLGTGPSTLYWSRQISGSTGFGIGAIGFDQADPNVVVDGQFPDAIAGDAADVFSAVASGSYPIRRSGLDRSAPATFIAGDAMRKTGLSADRCLLAYAEVNANSSGRVTSTGKIVAAPLTNAGAPQTLITSNVLDPQGAAVDELGAGGSTNCALASTDGGAGTPPPTTPTTSTSTTPTPPPPTTSTPAPPQLPTSAPAAGFTREQVDDLLKLALDYVAAHITDPNRLLDARYKIAQVILDLNASDTEWCGIGGCDGNDPFTSRALSRGWLFASAAALVDRRSTYAQATTTPSASAKRPTFAAVKTKLATLVSADKALTTGTRRLLTLRRGHATKATMAKARKAVAAAKAKLATVPLTTVKLHVSATGKRALRALALKAKKGAPAKYVVRLTFRDPVSGATASRTSIITLTRHRGSRSTGSAGS